jgi:hypothetical protein
MSGSVERAWRMRSEAVSCGGELADGWGIGDDAAWTVIGWLVVVGLDACSGMSDV